MNKLAELKAAAEAAIDAKTNGDDDEAIANDLMCGARFRRLANPATILKLIAAIEHYEAALKAAFPSGASGAAYEHWNKARKELNDD
jgi:hypothetical protein